MTNVM
ncbi:Protein of unknown function [Bacillus mycoides]